MGWNWNSRRAANPPDKWGVSVEGGVHPGFCYSTSPAHVQTGLCCNCNIPLIFLFSPLCQRLFFSISLIFFFPPAPLFLLTHLGQLSQQI